MDRIDSSIHAPTPCCLAALGKLGSDFPYANRLMS